MGNLGFQEILIIGIVVLVLFGGRKIPEFMRGIGKGIREFNDAKDKVHTEFQEGMKATVSCVEIPNIHSTLQHFVTPTT